MAASIWGGLASTAGASSGTFDGVLDRLMPPISWSPIGGAWGCSSWGDGIPAVTFGTTKLNSSCPFEGLLDGERMGGCNIREGVVRGDPKPFGVPALAGVGSFLSPGEETWPGRTILGTVRFGDELMDFGVTGFGLGLLGGLDCSAEG